MARIAELLGTPLFPAQRFVFDVALEVQSVEAGDPYPGEWAYSEVLDTEPRRSGKSFKAGPLVAHRCGSGENVSAWITAQKRANAVRRWDEVRRQLMGRVSPLRAELKALRGDGHEAIKWRASNSVFVPFAPSADAMHGEEPDLVIVDELWAHDLPAKARIEQGYKPAWSVKPGQAWLLSAAGTDASEWLNGRRATGAADVEAGRTLGRASFDWSVPDEVGGVAVEELPNDQLLDVVLDCHPRRDNGLRAAYLATELEDLGRQGFLRAYGNRTATVAARQVIEPDALKRAVSRTRIPPTARVGLGVEVDPERRESAVSAAWRDPASGVVVTELVRVAPGVTWLARFVADVVARQGPGAVCVNNAGPARNVADELERPDDQGGYGLELLRLSGGDFAAACARVHDELHEPRPTMLHRGETELASAIRAASRRRLAAGFAWSPAGTEPITALNSHTLAVWAADHMTVAVRPFRIA